jgi:hypothetical protein
MDFYRFVEGVFSGDEFYEVKSTTLTQVLGEGWCRHFKQFKESNSRKRKEAYEGFKSNSLVSANREGPFEAKELEPDANIGLAIKRSKSLLSKISLGDKSAAVGAIRKSGLYSHYNADSRTENQLANGTTLSKDNLGCYFSDEVHHARILKVERYLKKTIKELEEDKELSSLMGRPGMRIEFPDEFVVSLAYSKTSKRRIDVKSTDTSVRESEDFIKSFSRDFICLKETGPVRLTYEATEVYRSIDGAKTISALCANVAHSSDASILRYVVAYANKRGEPCVPIHDCFGTRPLARALIVDAVRLAYSELSFKCHGGGFFRTKCPVTGSFVTL